MFRNLTIAIICLFLMGCGHYPKAKKWTPTEKIMLGASWLATGADFYTSKKALKNPDNHEAYPTIGKHPSDLKLGIMMFVSQSAVTYLSHFFPKWRKALLGGKTAVNTGCAIHNSKLD